MSGVFTSESGQRIKIEKTISITLYMEKKHLSKLFSLSLNNSQEYGCNSTSQYSRNISSANLKQDLGLDSSH